MTMKVSKTSELIRPTDAPSGADGFYLIICSVEKKQEIYRQHFLPGQSYKPTGMERLGRSRIAYHLVSADPHIFTTIPLQVTVEDVDTVSIALHLDLAIPPAQVETFFKARSQKPLESLWGWVERNLKGILRQHITAETLGGGSTAIVKLMVDHLDAREIGLDAVIIPALSDYALQYGLVVNAVRPERDLSEKTRSELEALVEFDKEEAKLDRNKGFKLHEILVDTEIEKTKINREAELDKLKLLHKRELFADESGLALRQSVLDAMRTVITQVASDIDTPHKIISAFSELNRLISLISQAGDESAVPGLLGRGTAGATELLPPTGNRLSRLLFEVFSPLSTVNDGSPSARKLLALLAHCVAAASLGDKADSEEATRLLSELDDVIASGLAPIEKDSMDHIVVQTGKLRDLLGVPTDV